MCAVWIFFQPTIFRGFSLYLINLAGMLLDMRGSAQRPALHVNEPKKIGTRGARARNMAIPYSIYIFPRKTHSICTFPHFYLQCFAPFGLLQ